MTTNVPAIQFLPSGIVLPQESDVLTGVLADMNQAFGGGMNQGLTTPQGQLAQSETAIIGDKNNTIAYILNQINPNFASGVWQDAIGAIYFLTRLPAVPTTVQLLCTGANGTSIPIGAMAQDAGGNIYTCTQAGVIPIGGSITLSFACQTAGAIVCPSNTVTKIYQSIVGWDTVNNPTAGITGSLVESRANFEARRRASVAANAHGSLPSIQGAVFAVANVIDVYAYENFTEATINVGSTNYPLLPHSVYIGVVGGASQDIANAIWTKKNEGSNMNGNTPVVVYDTSYSVPYPQYNITYNVPASVPINFQVNVSDVNGVSLGLIIQIQNAIMAAMAGSDGGVRARIGSTIFASRFFAGIQAINPQLTLVSLLLGTGSPTLSSVTMGIDQYPITSAANINVTAV